MLFTDIIFPIFLFAVFSLYWLALRRCHKAQNMLLLAASYLFYGWWDWRFLGLIILTSASTYFSALAAQGRYGRIATAANVTLNLGLLAAFKYLGFFSENIVRLFNLFGLNLDRFTIDVLLPVGISFYTFQAISYSIDVYKGRIAPTRNPIAFFTYIAYFPQLVAGPIERATSLLPQIEAPRRWDADKAVTGLRMILFGVMKKVCVADMLAIYVDRLFDSGLQSSLTVAAAALMFTIQIYCDFSAYSEIARGTSRLLGIELMANFHFPYFSRNVIEFWQRWHISLMLWLRDYIYIPLGGSRRGERKTLRNITIVFLLSGLWHGAAWNFILWGAYWVVIYIIARRLHAVKRFERTVGIADLPAIVMTLGWVAIGFYIFRCSTVAELVAGLRALPLFAALFLILWAAARIVVSLPRPRLSPLLAAAIVIALVGALCIALPRPYVLLKAWWAIPAVLILLTEWHSRGAGYPMALLPASRRSRTVLYLACILFILISEPIDMAFIYFQF